MKYRLLFLFLLFHVVAGAQAPARPRLVVGMVVDQMRWDYLYRFADRYVEGGFKRMLREGFSCENTFINYTPTYTAPGHASVYTGSVPALHGIMGNNWYLRSRRKTIYCVDDSTVQGTGTTAKGGKMSPRNMWSSTVTDELRLAQQFQSKTIAIAIKDRGSIIPGGHSANAAYWFDNTSGGWVSSTYYMQQLPQWVQAFNARKLADGYLKQGWNTLFPLHSYQYGARDTAYYEGVIPGEDHSFPHVTAGIQNNPYESFRYLPASNTYTLQMAEAAIAGERLGSRGVTDFLAISFSATDYIGHTFGPSSVEVEDTYLRLDRDLAVFFTHLDKVIGKGAYLVFLTSDHAVAHNPQAIAEASMSSGSLNEPAVRRRLNDSLQAQFGPGQYIERAINYQYFLDHDLVASKGIALDSVKQFITRFLLRYDGIAAVVDLERVQQANLPEKLKGVLVNGYNQKLSGDLQLLYRPQWFENLSKGATHGLWNPYDAHIPLVWFGWKIPRGKTNREVYMTDIAPTVSALLKIPVPNASIGEVIEEVIR